MPHGTTRDRLHVTGLRRTALFDSLYDAAVADFVGDCVEAPAPLRRVRVGVGDPASLLEVDGIGRVEDGGMALMLTRDFQVPCRQRYPQVGSELTGPRWIGRWNSHR